MNEQLLEELKEVIGDPEGQCYAASEAAYHMLGGKEAGLTPKYVKMPKDNHWWLEDADGEIIDLTMGQYERQYVPYDKGKGCGFLTKKPSKRAQKIIDEVNERMAP